MTPLKDTLEVGNLSGESAGAQGSARAKPESSGLRSDAVSLDVPVKVHGSRVTEVVRGVTPHTEPFEEKSATMIVFPQGGVLKMTTTLSAGQMIVITNLKSGQDAICRVAKVRPYGKTHSYVEIEFTQRQAGYWGVYFPSDGPELAKKVAPAAPAASASTPAVAPPASRAPVHAMAEPAAPAVPNPVAKPSGTTSISSPANPPSAPVERSVQPNLPESQFVSIGSHEDVQPAASATTAPTPASFAESGGKLVSTEAPRKTAAMGYAKALPIATSPSVSMADVRGVEQVPLLNAAPADTVSENANPALPVVAPLAETPAPAFGRFAGGTGFDTVSSAPQDSFGTRLNFGTAIAAPPAAERGRNWLLIFAGAGALLAAIGGGAYYFYGRPGADRATNSMPPALAPAPEVNTGRNSVSEPPISSASSVSSPVVEQRNPVRPALATPSEPATTLRDSRAAPAKLGQAPPIAQSQPTMAGPQKTASAVPNLSRALKAHPVTSRPAKEGRSDTPPTLDATTVAGNANGPLPGIGASSVNLAVPARPAPKAPLRVGGNIKPPRMIASVLPVYPSIARQAGVQGNVVIETVVDETGSVASMKVVSGSPMLRQAALDALRQWKYEPSLLNGQPVSVEMIVTIQFHR